MGFGGAAVGGLAVGVEGLPHAASKVAPSAREVPPRRSMSARRVSLDILITWKSKAPLGVRFRRSGDGYERA